MLQIRLSGILAWGKVAPLPTRRHVMANAPRFEFLDNTLFFILLFVPINLLLAGALALAAGAAP